MIRKLLVALAVVTAPLALLGATAGAHVEVTAADEVGDDDVLLTAVFSEDECTNGQAKVELIFPDSPVLTVATPGEAIDWTAEVVVRPGTTEVQQVNWTNTTGAAGDGEFQLAIGPIADDGASIDFKAIQTCTDGEVIRWVQEQPDAEFPAPVLLLDHSGHTDGHSHDEESETASSSTEESESSDSTGLIIGIVAAVVIVGGGIAFFVLRRKPSTPAQ